MNKNVKIFVGIVAIFIIGNVVSQFMRMQEVMPYALGYPDMIFQMIFSMFGGLLGLVIPIIIFWKIFGVFGKGVEGLKNIDFKNPDSWKDFAKNLPQQMNTMTTLNTQKNFANLVAPEAGNPDAVKTELEKFKKIKTITEVNPINLDLTVIHKDDSEHLYRATIKGNKNNFQIISLSRYS